MKAAHRTIKYGKGYALKLSYVDTGKGSKVVTIKLSKGKE